MDALLDIGHRYNVPIIEDAAEAIGSIYKGKRTGSMGRFGVFSFHGTKTITTGEGGMFVTNDADFYESMLTYSNHGRSRGQTKQFWPDLVGFKYKMSNIQAAIGCAQIERIDELIIGKRRIFKAYEKLLSALPLTMNPEPEETVNGYWMPSIVADEGVPFNRSLLIEEFKKNNIDGRVFFWPLSMLPMFVNKPENKVSYGIYQRSINLPSYHDLTHEEIEHVAKIVIKQFS
jgi:perosamine synthetase